MKRLPSVVFVATVVFATACPPPNPNPTPDPSKSSVAVDRPSSGIADGADRVQITVTVRDTDGNPVSGAAVQIAASGTGNTLVQPAGPTDGSGVATGSLATTVAESKSISASIQQGTIGSTATAVFGPGPVSASASTVVATPASVVADGVASATITVTLRDASGNPVSGKNVVLSSTGSQNAFTQPSATDLRGGAVGVLRSTRAESKVIAATVDGAALLQQPSVQFVAAAAAKLAFTVPPGTIQANAAIAPPVQVEIQDANGNRVAGSTLPVTVSLAGGTSGAVLGGTRTVSAADGVAVFSDLSVDRAGTGYTLVAGGPGLGTTTSVPFDVTAGTGGGGNHLAFVARPSDTAAGTAISPAVQVALEDSSGNILSSVTAIVTVTLTGSGTLSGTTSVATAGGIANFGTLSIDRVQTGATLVASATGFTGATSQPFNIVPGPASRLVFSAQPSTAVSNATLSPAIRVSVQDAFGNVVTGDTRTVSLALGNNPGFGTLSGTTSVAASAGLATFSDLSLDRTGSGYTLVASASGVSSAVSAGFDITPGPATWVVFEGQLPPFVTAGAAFRAQAAIVDPAGNVVTSATDAITLSLSGGTAGAVLSGTLTTAAVGGRASFTNLSVDKAGGGYRLSTSAAGLLSTTSSSFSVLSGPPAKLAFTRQPVDSAAGTILPPVQVAIQDSLGNPTSSTAQVRVFLSSNPAGGTLSGSTVVGAVSGTATFSNLSVNLAGGYQLGAVEQADGGSLAGATSAPFTVNSNDVSGTRIVHYVQEDGGVIDVPADLSATTIAAYVPDGGGFNIFSGAGTDGGTFFVAGVPPGRYYLRFGIDFIDTSARALDLGLHQGGRPDVQVQTPGTFQRTQLAGLAPWTVDPLIGSDQLEMWSPGASLYVDNIDGLSADGGFAQAGDTTFDQVLDYDGFFLAQNLVSASQGDTTWFTQLQVRDAGQIFSDAGTLLLTDGYRALVQATGPLAATVAPRVTSTISASMSSAPARSISLDWKVSAATPNSFGALRTAVNPNAETGITHSLYIDAIPLSQYGFYVSSPDMVIMSAIDNQSVNRPDLQLTLQYGDPFPPAWPRFAQATTAFLVHYDLPLADGGTARKFEAGVIENLDLLPSFATAPLRPQVSPITNAQVDGQPFFSDQTLNTTTPTISWSPPAVGSPTLYTVRIRRLRPVGARVDVAILLTAATSIQVPPGIFTSGNDYYVRLTAIADPARTVQVPYDQHWPRNSAQALSGLLHVP